MKPRNSCELCNGEAFLYCYSDSAFLCWDCDRRVHSANFLVARHLRQISCSSCRSFRDFSLTLSGSGSNNPIRSLCRSCNPNPNPSPSSSSSSCITAESDCESESEAGPEEESTAEARMMERWGEAMGLREARWIADVADHVRRKGSEAAAAPTRAAMAGALWHVARERDRTCGEGMLGKLEKCCGVPARVIVIQASRIRHAMWKRRREEGCGESS